MRAGGGKEKGREIKNERACICESCCMEMQKKKMKRQAQPCSPGLLQKKQ